LNEGRRTALQHILALQHRIARWTAVAPREIAKETNKQIRGGKTWRGLSILKSPNWSMPRSQNHGHSSKPTLNSRTMIRRRCARGSPRG
jgi:hypothetical protein